MTQPFSKLATALRRGWTIFRDSLAIPKAAPADYPFAPSDVAQLHRVAGHGAGLDDQTWRDLLLDRYLDQVAERVSIAGRQELYRRLRAGLLPEQRAAQVGRVQALMREPERVSALTERMLPLRTAEAEVAALLYEAQCPPVPRWAGRTWLLSVALLAALAGVAVTPWSWAPVALAMYLLISLQVRYDDRMHEWARLEKTLRLVLGVTSVLGEDRSLDERGFAEASKRAGPINRSLDSASAIRYLPGGSEYADWFGGANVSHYFKSLRIVFEERDFLRECYLRCAALEADLALARYLGAAPRWCWAGQAAGRALALEDAVHPLLRDATPLTLALEGKGLFVSGQNGIGKSTFLRTIGLNVAVAQGFGFCHAGRASVPELRVHASMQNEDSLFGGESLYVAELRRARELVQLAHSRVPAIYIVDEIFRGTNHVESVSAGAAVIDTLAASGLAMVASHHLVLASLLAHRLEARCLERDGDQLVLRDGVLEETNGVSLLAAHGFGEEISGKAASVAHWLARYLANPADAGTVLAGEEAGRRAA